MRNMAFVCEENMCCGCMACVSVCKKNAIKIVDSLDAYNAIINEECCINCNACKKICQSNHKPIGNKPTSWYQGWANSMEIRKTSSSGGLAASLSKQFVKSGGYVCSCSFKDGKFGFDFASSIEQCDLFTGSKYVKSNPDGIYEKIKKLLSSGEKVLFIGLPCQVAAVKNYCRMNDKNLYLIDLICHGTPSPQILEHFLLQSNYSLRGMKNIYFRRKANFKIECDYKSIVPERVLDMYMYAFLQGVDYTENCYHCDYAQLERVSDLTIGDSWGTDLSLDEQRNGISLILCQTDKGAELLDNAILHLEAVDLNKATEANTQLRHPTIAPKEREKFFKEFKLDNNFNRAISKCYPRLYYKQKLKLFLIKLKILGEDVRKL